MRGDRCQVAESHPLLPRPRSSSSPVSLASRDATPTGVERGTHRPTPRTPRRRGLLGSHVLSHHSQCQQRSRRPGPGQLGSKRRLPIKCQPLYIQLPQPAPPPTSPRFQVRPLPHASPRSLSPSTSSNPTTKPQPPTRRSNGEHGERGGGVPRRLPRPLHLRRRHLRIPGTAPSSSRSSPHPICHLIRAAAFASARQLVHDRT